MEQEKKIEGLGGWLILVGIGVVFSPIRIMATLIPPYKEIFEQGYWHLLTTPGTEVYDPLWAPILLSEITINALLALVMIFLIYLFFSKKKLFPKFFIGVLIFSPIFILLDALAVKFVLSDEPIFDPDTMKEFARSMIAACIWIPYMLISKRVKATFVK